MGLSGDSLGLLGSLSSVHGSVGHTILHVLANLPRDSRRLWCSSSHAAEQLHGARFGDDTHRSVAPILFDKQQFTTSAGWRMRWSSVSQGGPRSCR